LKPRLEQKTQESAAIEAKMESLDPEFAAHDRVQEGVRQIKRDIEALRKDYEAYVQAGHDNANRHLERAKTSKGLKRVRDFFVYLLAKCEILLAQGSHPTLRTEKLGTWIVAAMRRLTAGDSISSVNSKPYLALMEYSELDARNRLRYSFLSKLDLRHSEGTGKLLESMRAKLDTIASHEMLAQAFGPDAQNLMRGVSRDGKHVVVAFTAPGKTEPTDPVQIRLLGKDAQGQPKSLDIMSAEVEVATGNAVMLDGIIFENGLDIQPNGSLVPREWTSNIHDESPVAHAAELFLAN
jgi:hypothetical protein